MSLSDPDHNGGMAEQFRHKGGGFVLPRAVTEDPSFKPKAGYKTCPKGGKFHIKIAVSSENIIGILSGCIAGLGKEVGLIIESCHDGKKDEPEKMHVYRANTMALKSRLLDFEDFIVNDGFLKIIVKNTSGTEAVTLTPQKTIIFSTAKQERIDDYKLYLEGQNIPNDQDIFFAEDGKHHQLNTEPRYMDDYSTFCCLLQAVPYDEDMQTLLDHDKNDPYGFRGDDWWSSSDEDGDDPDNNDLRPGS